MAEYWPRVGSSVGFEPPEAEGDDGGEEVIEGEECFRVVGRNAEEARWCAVLTEPLNLMLDGGGGGEGKKGRVRKVRFEIVSHDQGWSGEPEQFKGGRLFLSVSLSLLLTYDGHRRDIPSLAYMVPNIHHPSSCFTRFLKFFFFVVVSGASWI